MDLHPTDLRYFFEVTRTLNISRAAERLGVGQPTVSQAIRRLEANFGTRLLDRYKTGVRLTAAGERLLREGRPALENWARLKETVTASHSQIEGLYSIGCHPSVGLYALPTFMKKLVADNPGLELRLAHGLSREIAEQVVSFKLDFGLVINPVPHPDLVIRELCRDEVGLWSAAGAVTDTLLLDPALAQSQALLKRLKKAKLTFRRRTESTHLEILAVMAQSGCGVAMLPARVAQRFVGLKPFKPGVEPFEDKLCLVYRADRRFSAAAKLIADTILKAKI